MDEVALEEAERVLRSKGLSRITTRRAVGILRELTSEEVTKLFEACDPVVRAATKRWLVPVVHTVVEVVVDRAISTSNATPALLTIKEVARRLNVSERSVERLIAAGQIVPLWIGESRRFAPEAIDAFLRRYAVRGRSHKRG